MWSSFKALAARIGLPAEKVAAVEQEGGASLVPPPLDDRVEFLVRPDPDWTLRLGEAWQGTLVNSRRETAGNFQIIERLLEISDVDSPGKSITVPVVPGEYEVILTIAHLGSEETYDYEEYISHAFAILKGNRPVAAIEPLSNEEGVELSVNAYTMGFGTDGVVREAGGDHAGRWSLKLGNMFYPEFPNGANRRDWVTIKTIMVRAQLSLFMWVMAGVIIRCFSFRTPTGRPSVYWLTFSFITLVTCAKSRSLVEISTIR